MDCYIYRHIREDLGIPFYVGIAQKKHDNDYSRSISHNGNSRSLFWKRIVAKTAWISEVMLDDLTWEEACEKEKEFIKLYGRANLGLGTLCNLTDGGDGRLGYIATEEFRRKISETSKGRRHSSETKEKQRIGSTGRRHSEVTKQKLRDKNTGVSVDKLKKLLINTETGIYYLGVKEAAESVDITRTALIDRLLGRVRNYTNLKYV